MGMVAPIDMDFRRFMWPGYMLPPMALGTNNFMWPLAPARLNNDLKPSTFVPNTLTADMNTTIILSDDDSDIESKPNLEHENAKLKEQIEKLNVHVEALQQQVSNQNEEPSAFFPRVSSTMNEYNGDASDEQSST